MKKVTAFSLALIMVMTLAGCLNTIDSSEVYAFPEPTYQIQVSHFVSDEMQDYFLGTEEYDADNNVLLPILNWYNSLEMIEMVINEGEPTPNMEVEGGESYSFIVNDELAFIYFDLSPNSYIMTNKDKWYEVENPSLPDFSDIETYDIPEPIDWGITLITTDVTPTGLTLTCAQNGGGQKGELKAGSFYRLSKLENSTWIDVEYITDDEVAWLDDEVYNLSENDTATWEIDWEFPYGELSVDEYRISKTVTDFVEGQDYEERIRQTYFATFEIE